MSEKKVELTDNNPEPVENRVQEFYSDCTCDGMQYAVLVRSPAASGIITNISVPKLPDGYFLFTAHDIPGKNEIATNGTVTPVFCAEKVSYLGEPVGILVGPDLKTVSDLSSSVELTFDQSTLESVLETVAKGYTRPVISLPGKTNAAEIAEITRAMNLLPAEQPVAATPLIPQTDPVTPLTSDKHIVSQRIVRTGSFSDIDPNDTERINGVFKNAFLDISDSWEERNTQAYWLETNGAFCVSDSGKLIIHTPTQWPLYLQKSVATVLGIPSDSVVVKKTHASPQNTNGIWRNTTLSAQTALASYLTGKPVILELSRSEQQQFMAPGVAVQITHRSSVTEDGRLTASYISITVNIGAWNPFSSELLDRLVIASCSIYMPENALIIARAYATQEPPTSMYSHLLDSQSFFAAESHLQQITERLHMLPSEIRLKNITAENTLPFQFKLNNPEEMFNTLLSISDFNRKYTAFSIEAKERNETQSAFLSVPMRGIGFACAFDGSGYLSTDLFSSDQKMEVTIEADDTVSIHALTPSLSIADIWKTAAADILNVSKSMVNITSNFSERDTPPLPETTYNNISIMTLLLKKCCTDLKKKRDEQTPLPITVHRGIAASMKKQWDIQSFHGFPFHTTSLGSTVIEIEVDPYTYAEKIKGIWVVIDCGEILSVKAAEATIRLSIQQELSQLFSDEIIPCEKISITFIQSSDNPGQIGDMIHNTVPAAFRAALSQALTRPITHLPCTLEDCYAPDNGSKDENKK